MTVPGGYFSLTSVQGLTSVCFMPRLISCLALSMARTTTSTWSPTLTSSEGWLTRRVHDISLTWTSPSTPSSSLTNAPYGVMLTTSPSAFEPIG